MSELLEAKGSANHQQQKWNTEPEELSLGIILKSALKAVHTDFCRGAIVYAAKNTTRSVWCDLAM